MTMLSDQVRVFMTSTHQETRDTPGLPSVSTLKLRARLVIEEAFEFVQALYKGNPSPTLRDRLENLKLTSLELISYYTPAPSLPDTADACADLDYVVEGCRIALGVQATPIADEVHAANMLKLTGPIDEHGKRQKPEGWTPPDIRKVLIAQGWVEGGQDDI